MKDHGTMSRYQQHCRCKVCKSAIAKYNRPYTQRHRRMKRDALMKLKNVPCLHCNQSFPSPVMDFSHRDSSNKLYSISENVNNKSLDDLLEEAAKCDVLCANCHRIVTQSQQFIPKGDYLKRKQFILSFKDKPCLDCNTKYPPFVMDFDHRDPSDKLFEINGSAANRSKANIELEIAKCDLLCANCHRIRTWGINLILD